MQTRDSSSHPRRISAHIFAALALSLTLPCCVDDDLPIGSPELTASGAASGSSGDDDPTVPAPTEGFDPDPGDSSTGDEPEETTGETGDVVTGGVMPGEGDGGGEGGEDAKPVKDPPMGCGVIVETLIRAPKAERFIVIDASACKRTAILSAEVESFDLNPPVSTILGNVSECAVFGGLLSEVTDEPTWKAANLGAAAAAMDTFAVAIYVDGVLSDNVRFPSVLKDQEWDDAPLAPAVASRRAVDFSWRVTGSHVPGCDLIDG